MREGLSISRIARTLRPRERDSAGFEIRRLEEKEDQLNRAVEQWLSLLREMEMNGEAGDGKYEKYYSAYIEAKQQHKLADVELFNARHRLTAR